MPLNCVSCEHFAGSVVDKSTGTDTIKCEKLDRWVDRRLLNDCPLASYEPGVDQYDWEDEHES